MLYLDVVIGAGQREASRTFQRRPAAIIKFRYEIFQVQLRHDIPPPMQPQYQSRRCTIGAQRYLL
jgi:hypothetical protein